MIAKASRQNSYTGKLGKSPQQGGGVNNFIGQFPSRGWEMQTGGEELFKTFPNLKNRIFSDKKIQKNI